MAQRHLSGRLHQQTERQEDDHIDQAVGVDGKASAYEVGYEDEEDDHDGRRADAHRWRELPRLPHTAHDAGSGLHELAAWGQQEHAEEDQERQAVGEPGD